MVVGDDVTANGSRVADDFHVAREFREAILYDPRGVGANFNATWIDRFLILRTQGQGAIGRAQPPRIRRITELGKHWRARGTTDAQQKEFYRFSSHLLSDACSYQRNAKIAQIDAVYNSG